MPLRHVKRSRPSSGDQEILSEILRSVKSFDLRLRKIEDGRRSSRHRSRSTDRSRDRSRRSNISGDSRHRRNRDVSRCRIRRRIVSSSSTSSSDGSNSCSQASSDYRDKIRRDTAQCSPSVEFEEKSVEGEHVTPGQDMQPVMVDKELDSEVHASRNRDFQSLLGDECIAPTRFAPPLHADIASRWNFILRHGLDLGKRTEVLQRYAPPEKCVNVIPPNLNPHVKGALSESKEKRDARLANLQKQVGTGVAAIGKVLSSLYQKGDEGDRENIQALSDAGRLLADIHYQETMSRRDLVLLNINRELRDTLSNSPPDEWLFGSNLEEVIRVKKTIDSSSQQLKTKKVGKKPSQPVVNKILNYNRPFRSNRGAYRSGQQSRQAPRLRTQFRRKQDQWRNRDIRQ